MGFSKGSATVEIATVCVGPLMVNCYLAAPEPGGSCLIIDPGDEPEHIAERIERNRYTPIGVALTHAHVDHIRGAGRLARDFAIPVLLHPADRDLYRSPANALPPWVPAAEDLPPPEDIRGFDWPALGGTVIETPGHTPGGVCIHFPEAAVLFSGDTLFAGSVGRTDFPGGDMAVLRASIRERLYRLPPHTRVYPGHGPHTTIGREMQANPFVTAKEIRP